MSLRSYNFKSKSGNNHDSDLCGSKSGTGPIKRTSNCFPHHAAIFRTKDLRYPTRFFHDEVEAAIRPLPSQSGKLHHPSQKWSSSRVHPTLSPFFLPVSSCMYGTAKTTQSCLIWRFVTVPYLMSTKQGLFHMQHAFCDDLHDGADCFAVPLSVICSILTRSDAYWRAWDKARVCMNDP